MDDLRESFSEMKKRIKHRLKGKNRKADEARASGGGVGVDNVEPSGSLPPQAVTGDDSERGGNEPNVDDEGVGPSTAADQSESDWKTTASATAKLLLRGVGSSSDAFGPLKSVAGGLCFILENCEVRLPIPDVIRETQDPVAHESEQTIDRIVGTESQDAQRAALQARS